MTAAGPRSRGPGAGDDDNESLGRPRKSTTGRARPSWDCWTRYQSAVLDALVHGHLTGREVKVVLAIIRKTLAFRKLRDELSLSQLAAMTHISGPNVSRVIDSLVRRRIITIEGAGRYARIIRLHPDPTGWDLSKEARRRVAKTTTPGVAETTTEPLPKQQGSRCHFENHNFSHSTSVIPMDLAAKGSGTEVGIGTAHEREAADPLDAWGPMVGTEDEQP